MADLITRRRVIRIGAAAAGFTLLPLAEKPRAAAAMTTWRGTMLGAVATMQIQHPDHVFAERLIERCLSEARQLERLFSLYRADSDLIALNRHGAIAAPAAELVELLSESQRYSALTDGAFDVTVQPLWDFYVEYFSRPDAAPEGPPAEAIAAILHRVGNDALLVDRNRVAFAKRGMAVTLNGIAQGYITDRVVDLLRSEGITQTLVDMGETRCLDTHPTGRPWRVGIADPDQPSQVKESLAVVNQAVATSGGYGFRFDAEGRFNHLFNPKSGESPHAYQSVTVVAPTATAADALSTAFSLMDGPDIDRVLSKVDNTTAYLIMGDGTMTRHLPLGSAHSRS
jgi:thiamine biosynthesis lipoprotein